MVPPLEDLSSLGTPEGSHSPLIKPARCLPYQPGLQFKTTNIREVLQYLKRSFDDEAFLDTLPLEAAGNSGAWKAWRAYRRSNNPDSDVPAFESATNEQGEWSWDGVWELRVQKGIDASIAESTLYGGTMGGDDLVGIAISIWHVIANGTAQIRFVDMDEDLLREVREEVMSFVGRS